MPTKPLSASQTQTCPRCGATFTCGLATRQARCWCFDMPKAKLTQAELGNGCLCADCLRAVIEKHLQEQPSS